MLLLPSAHPIRAPLSWNQLDGLALIEPVGRRTNSAIEHLREAGLRVRATQRLASDSGIMAMIALGGSFSVFPRLATIPLPQGVASFELGVPFKREFALIAHARTARDPAVRAVMRVLRERSTLSQTPACRSGAYSLA